MQIGKSPAAGFAAVVLFAFVWLTGQSVAGPREIDIAASQTLERFFYRIGGTREMANRAAGVLVFPSVVKAGFGLGGEYGEGALLIRGRTAAYYSDVSGSFGFQIGAQARSVIIMFMTAEALDAFNRRDGWKVGVDGSVAIINVGAGGSVDSNTIARPVVGFIFDQKGLMYNLTLEGSKISRTYR